MNIQTARNRITSLSKPVFAAFAAIGGTYTGVSHGLTLIEGKMHAKLTNGNGVVVYIAGETEGLASSIGVQAFNVTLGN